jgi:hypothetical protein
MEGAWTRTDRKGHVLGKGQLKAGAGTWHSFYPDGKRLADGAYAASLPHGAWTLYHPSGNVAAEGGFARGERHGAWRFYYDAPGKPPIAAGAFDKGSITGRWEHFDRAGKLAAVSSDATPASWKYTAGGHLLDVMPGADGVRHVVHYGNIMASDWRLDGFFLGGERLYVQGQGHYGSDWTFDAGGHLLTKQNGAWLAADCGWSEKRKTVARNGDVTTLHGLLYQDAAGESPKEPACGTKQAVPADRGARLDKLLAARTAVRTPSPAFVKEAAAQAWGDPAKAFEEEATGEPVESFTEVPETPAAKPTPEELAQQARWDAEEADLTKTLAKFMGWFIEFPHVDGRFVRVFYTLPGFTPGLRNAEFAEDSTSE